MAATTRKAAAAAAAAKAGPAGTSASATRAGALLPAQAGGTNGDDAPDSDSASPIGQLDAVVPKKRKKTADDEAATAGDDDQEIPRKKARAGPPVKTATQKRKLENTNDDSEDGEEDEAPPKRKRAAAPKSRAAPKAPPKSKAGAKGKLAAKEAQDVPIDEAGVLESAASQSEEVAPRGRVTGQEKGAVPELEAAAPAGQSPKLLSEGEGPSGADNSLKILPEDSREAAAEELVPEDDEDADNVFINSRALAQRKLAQNSVARDKALKRRKNLENSSPPAPPSRKGSVEDHVPSDAEDDKDDVPPVKNTKAKQAQADKSAPPKPSAAKAAPAPASRKASVEDHVPSDAEDDKDDAPPVKNTKAKQAQADKSAPPKPSAAKAAPAPASRKATVEDYIPSDADDDDVVVGVAQPVKKAKAKQSAGKAAPVPPSRKATVEDYVSSDSDDDDDVVVARPVKKSKAKTSAGKAAPAPPSHKATVEDYITTDAEDDKDEKQPVKHAKGKPAHAARKKSSAPPKPSARTKSKGKKISPSKQDPESEEAASSVEIDADLAELDEDEKQRVKRHTKPGPLTKEEAAEFEQHVQDFEQWMMAFAARTGKSLEYLWNLSRIKFKLKRDRSIWNMFQERWSLENPRQDGESLDAYHERRRAAYSEATSGMTKKQKAGLKKELEEWADKCDEELAKLTIEAGDMFKVMHRLGDDIDGLTRPYWSNYHIAVFGFMLCVDKADAESIAMNGCFSNTPVARKWLTGKHINVRSLLADFANLFGVHLLNEAEKDDWSRDAYGRFATARGQVVPRDTVKHAFRFWRKLLRGEPVPGEKGEIPWLKIESEVLVALKRVINWPDDVPLPSIAKGKWLVPAQKKLMRFLFQAHRLTTGTLEDKEDSISASGVETVVKRDSPDFDPKKILMLEDIPKDELDKMGTDWDGWYNTPIWTTRSGKVLLHVRDLVGKVNRYGNHMFPEEMVRPDKRKIEGFDDDDAVKIEANDSDRKARGKKARGRGRNAIGGGHHRIKSRSQVQSTESDDADDSASDEDAGGHNASRKSRSPSAQKPPSRAGHRRSQKTRRPSLPSSDDEKADSESESAAKTKGSSRRSTASRTPVPDALQGGHASEGGLGVASTGTSRSPSPPPRSPSPPPLPTASPIAIEGNNTRDVGFEAVDANTMRHAGTSLEGHERAQSMPGARPATTSRAKSVSASLGHRQQESWSSSLAGALGAQEAPTSQAHAARNSKSTHGHPVSAARAVASSSSLAGALALPGSSPLHARARSEAPTIGRHAPPRSHAPLPSAPLARPRAPTQPPLSRSVGGGRDGANTTSEPGKEYQEHDIGLAPHAQLTMAPPAPPIQSRAPSQPLADTQSGNGLGDAHATRYRGQGYGMDDHGYPPRVHGTAAPPAGRAQSRAPSQPPLDALPGNGFGGTNAMGEHGQQYRALEHEHVPYAHPATSNTPQIPSTMPAHPPPAEQPGSGFMVMRPEQDYASREGEYAPRVHPTMAPRASRIPPRAPSQPPSSALPGNDPGVRYTTAHPGQDFAPDGFGYAEQGSGLTPGPVQHVQPRMAPAPRMQASSQPPAAAPRMQSLAPSQPPAAAPRMQPRAPSQPPSAAPSAAPFAAPSAAPFAAPSQPPAAAPRMQPRAPSQPPAAAPRMQPRAPSQPPFAAPRMQPRAPSQPPSTAQSAAQFAAQSAAAPRMQPRAPSQPPSTAPSAAQFAAQSAAPSDNDFDRADTSPYTGQGYETHDHVYAPHDHVYAPHVVPTIELGDTTAASQHVPRFLMHVPSRPPAEHTYSPAPGGSQPDPVPLSQSTEPQPMLAPVSAYGYEGAPYGTFASRGAAEQLAPVREEPIDLGADGQPPAPQTPSQMGYWFGDVPDGEADAAAYPGVPTWGAMEHGAMSASQVGIEGPYGEPQDAGWIVSDVGHSQDDGTGSYAYGR